MYSSRLKKDKPLTTQEQKLYEYTKQVRQNRINTRDRRVEDMGFSRQEQGTSWNRFMNKTPSQLNRTLGRSKSPTPNQQSTNRVLNLDLTSFQQYQHHQPNQQHQQRVQKKSPGMFSRYNTNNDLNKTQDLQSAIKQNEFRDMTCYERDRKKVSNNRKKNQFLDISCSSDIADFNRQQGKMYQVQKKQVTPSINSRISDKLLNDIEQYSTKSGRMQVKSTINQHHTSQVFENLIKNTLYNQDDKKRSVNGKKHYSNNKSPSNMVQDSKPVTLKFGKKYFKNK